MNIFGFNTLEAVLALFTFAAGGIFFGFLLQFVKFVMYGFMSTDYSWGGREVKKYD